MVKATDSNCLFCTRNLGRSLSVGFARTGSNPVAVGVVFVFFVSFFLFLFDFQFSTQPTVRETLETLEGGVFGGKE